MNTCPRCDEECDENEMLECYNQYHQRVSVCPECDADNLCCEICGELYDPEYETEFPEGWSEDLTDEFVCSECALDPETMKELKEIAEEQEEKKQLEIKRWEAAIAKLTQRLQRQAKQTKKETKDFLKMIEKTDISTKVRATEDFSPEDNDVCCVGCGEYVCDYWDEDVEIHKDERGEAVCDDCWGCVRCQRCDGDGCGECIEE